MSNENRVTEVRSVQKEPERGKRVFSFKATQLVWLVFGVLEALIGLRFILKLIAANPDSPIAAMIYKFTDLFLWPFAGLTATPAAGGMVLEISTLIALVIYALIGWAIERLIWVLFYRERGPIEQVTQTTSSEQHTDQQQPPK
jgi:hypothetical protein